MTSFRVQKSGYEWNGHTERFTRAFEEEARPRVTAAVSQLVLTSQQLSPVDQGTFRNSIASDVSLSSPMQIIGSVFSQDNPVKVQVIEGVDAQGNEQPFGRRQGRFPNITALRGWVARKTGLTGRALDSATFLIARSIARRGIPAVRPFKNAFTIKEPEIDRLFSEELPAAINARLEG